MSYTVVNVTGQLGRQVLQRAAVPEHAGVCVSTRIRGGRTQEGGGAATRRLRAPPALGGRVSRARRTAHL